LKNALTMTHWVRTVLGARPAASISRSTAARSARETTCGKRSPIRDAHQLAHCARSRAAVDSAPRAHGPRGLPSASPTWLSATARTTPSTARRPRRRWWRLLERVEDRRPAGYVRGASEPAPRRLLPRTRRRRR
jgi:hypothetical protein